MYVQTFPCVCSNLFFSGSWLSGTAGADEDGRQVNYLSLSVGKSIVVNSARSVTRVSIGRSGNSGFYSYIAQGNLCNRHGNRYDEHDHLEREGSCCYV